MSQAAVLHEIATLLLVALVGWGVRRIGLLDDASVRRASRLVVDVAMPALVFASLVDTTDLTALRDGWYVPALGAAALVIAWIVGRAMAPLGGASRPTFVFVAGLPNWIYLPLPIAAAAYGEAGIRTVLLLNVGAMLLLWTAGVAILRGSTATRDLLVNPGLLATVAAMIAIVWDPALPGPPAAWAAADQAIAHVGSITIPLSLLLTGAQLAAAPVRFPQVPVLAVTVARLGVAPLITVALLLGGEALGLRLDAHTRDVLVLVAAMPVAISASMFAERFGGDVPLASQAILWTTPLSLATVPAIFALLAAL